LHSNTAKKLQGSWQPNHNFLGIDFADEIREIIYRLSVVPVSFRFVSALNLFVRTNLPASAAVFVQFSLFAIRLFGDFVLH